VTVRAYPAYRESGVEWIGLIPSAWTTQRFRYLFRESSEKIEHDVFGEMLSVSGYKGIKLKEYDDDNRRRSAAELEGYRIVRKGQLVVNTMWMNYAGLGVSYLEGHVSPAYRAYYFRGDLNRDYAHNLLRSGTYVKAYTSYLTGIRPNSLQMSRDSLMDFPILVPPLDEQGAIAAFLNRETGKIDALVAEQERLIALLKEKRQTVISHAVTKGLNPNAPMKDSGVPWLGEVPAHWIVTRAKVLATLITSGPRGWSERIADDGVLFIQSGDIDDKLSVETKTAKRVAVILDAEAARSRGCYALLISSAACFSMYPTKAMMWKPASVAA
jgi:type I restriction enzyme S subunit